MSKRVDGEESWSFIRAVDRRARVADNFRDRLSVPTSLRKFHRRWPIMSLARRSQNGQLPCRAAAILRAKGPAADISPAQAYRYKYGFGLNWEQEVARSVGVFSRLGWNDGENRALEFTDANWTASLGTSIKGDRWRRPGNTFGLAGVLSGASRENQNFLAAGGVRILDGDGALTYGSEKVMETYYEIQVWKNIHLAADYQFISNPAFNRDRGPLAVFLGRLHWELNG